MSLDKDNITSHISADDGGEIINRVDQSDLFTFNLEDHYTEGERVEVDLKPWLFEGIILKEKDFRESLKNHDWSFYKDKFVALLCSADAIVPTWAFMLAATSLEPYARKIVTGGLNDLESEIYRSALSGINPEDYRDRKIIIKGCSNKKVPESAYVEITRILRPVARSIFYGEPCSTVPLYKKNN